MKDADLKYIPDSKFNYFKELNIFFFSYYENELYLLLHKYNDNQNYSGIKCDILEIDGSPIITTAKILTSKYYGLFKESNIKNVLSNIKLRKSDIEFFDFYTNNDKIEHIPANLMKNKDSYKEWIRKLFLPQIQYDNIEGKLIYLFNIPFVNTKNFNLNIEDLNLPFRFEFFKYQDLKSRNLDQIHENTLNILNFFDIDEHIRSTIEVQINNNYDNYIILSLECVEKFNNINLNYGEYEYINLVGNLRRNKENWIFLKDTMPSDELLKKNCRAVIIPGSISSVYNFEKRTVEAIEWLKKFINEYIGIKLLGVCYGHQIINEAFGGKVRKLESGNFINYIEEIKLDNTFWELNFVKESDFKMNHLNVYEVHGDEVCIIPDGFRCYGNSLSCNYEVIVSNDERIFTTQGHPELTPSNLFSCVLDNDSINLEDYNIQLNKHLEKTNLRSSSDREVWFRLYYKFLRI